MGGGRWAKKRIRRNEGGGGGGGLIMVQLLTTASRICTMHLNESVCVGNLKKKHSVHFYKLKMIKFFFFCICHRPFNVLIYCHVNVITDFLDLLETMSFPSCAFISSQVSVIFHFFHFLSREVNNKECLHTVHIYLND